MKKIFSSLRFRLILFVLLSALPALAIVLFTGIEQREKAAQDATSEAERLARLAADKHDILIEDTRVLLLSLSHSFNVVDENLVNCWHLFEHLQQEHFPFYSAFYVADLKGNILCSMPDGDLPLDLWTCEHYQSLIQTDDFVVSEYHICRNTGKAVISMGYPVWDRNDFKTGVINVSIDLKWFNQFAEDAQLSQGSTLSVFDRNGFILTHYPDPDRWAGQTMAEDPIVKEILARTSGTAEGYGFDGVRRLFAFTALAGSDNGVFLSIGIPKDVAFAQVQKTTNRNLILLGMATTLALVAAWFLGEVFILRKTQILVDTTRRIADGDLNARTNIVEAEGEIATLARSIDSMAESLNQREKERDLAEKAVREYAADLERTNRDLRDFANIASHDLQEPLRKIQTFGEMLRLRYDDHLDTRGRDYLHRMDAAANRMQRLIIDLLTYSRIETKTNPFEMLNLNYLVRSVVSDLDWQIEENKAKIVIEELPTIEADPVQLRQLIQNLITNAMKFHRPEVPPEITISASCPDGNLICEISVSDNGIGFDQKFAERIFQPFQRLHSPEIYPGTGMGLAICRKIAERHGGTIVAKSTLMEGSTFLVRLPARQNSGGGHA